MTATPYTYQESLINRQKQSEEAMLAEFAGGHYTLEAPLIKLNPYLIAPLTAMVLFETEIALEAEVTVLGKTPQIVSATASLQAAAIFCPFTAFTRDRPIPSSFAYPAAAATPFRSPPSRWMKQCRKPFPANARQIICKMS